MTNGGGRVKRGEEVFGKREMGGNQLGGDDGDFERKGR